MARKSKKITKKEIEAFTHEEATRKNIPTAEYESVIREELKSPVRVAYERRNRDLDPQLVWRGKDEQDWSDLVVHAPPLYIQEKVHPKALIDDLVQRSKEAKPEGDQFNLFADFNGVPEGDAKTEFYQHDANWTNRMILGDSLQVMASLAEREGLRGQVQCIYLDPPYGIKFNSNFQWSTTSRDVTDGKTEHITREPEQVRAFRDTWKDGTHSYLSYLRDRLTAARELLAESGSVFVQIGDENIHRVRSLLDEVFGEDRFIAAISFQTTPYATSNYLPSVLDSVLWYSKSDRVKYRNLFKSKSEIKSLNLYRQALSEDGETRVLLTREEIEAGPSDDRLRQYRLVSLISQGGASTDQTLRYREKDYRPPLNSHWKVTLDGMGRVAKASRIQATRSSIQFRSFIDDFPISITNNIWTDTITGSFHDPKVYVVQTNPEVVRRCVLMTTDPGDLVLDPTCGSGTTSHVCEELGRRWITIDTSRVALALARSRLMSARYPYYLLADSREGQLKKTEITRSTPSESATYSDIRQGFVYERVPHITLGSIANNAEIDVIWERYRETLEHLRQQINQALGQSWEEWEIPRDTDGDWADEAKLLHAQWWEQRIARQKEIDASIAAKADFEYLYDKPYEDKKTVRVAGPFTVESLSPHRTMAVGPDDVLIDPAEAPNRDDDAADFAQLILENLRTAGVQQAHKQDKIGFSTLAPWPGEYICAEGRYSEGEDGPERRAAIFIGPEFGTVSRPDLVAAAREAGDGGFDVLIACAFSYDAHSADFDNLGRIPVLKARMNADLHMAEDLKSTGKGNLFVIFGEPEIDIRALDDGRIEVEVLGVDVFDPSKGEIRSDDPDGIACWFIDTDYNEESFFVRHAYFLGQNDPYKALKTTLKAEIDEEAWESLNSAVSRPFDKPKSGRIAVKVINHLGDEVMKVFRVG